MAHLKSSVTHMHQNVTSLPKLIIRICAENIGRLNLVCDSFIFAEQCELSFVKFTLFMHAVSAES